MNAKQTTGLSGSFPWVGKICMRGRDWDEHTHTDNTDTHIDKHRHTETNTHTEFNFHRWINTDYKYLKSQIRRIFCVLKDVQGCRKASCYSNTHAQTHTRSVSKPLSKHFSQTDWQRVWYLTSLMMSKTSPAEPDRRKKIPAIALDKRVSGEVWWAAMIDASSSSMIT